jgi:ribosomal protein S18 acetylase RimI-like enzyme
VSAGVRPFTPEDLPEVVALALRAWAPVFASMADVLGAAVFDQLYPDWEAAQAQSVEAVCTREGTRVWVAEDESGLAGFVTVVLHDETYDEPNSGEIEMLAVDPARQGRGVGGQLTDHAMDAIRQAGCRLAVVATGGDPGHAPARRVYERAGFRAMPLVRYYQAL